LAFANRKTSKGNQAMSNQELVPAGDPDAALEAYLRENRPNNIVGTLLKFSKGRFAAGEDAAPVPLGTKLVANLNMLLVGYHKWHDGYPVAQEMGLVLEGFVTPDRKTLGDNEEDGGWEKDANGIARDPWQQTNYLVLKPEGQLADEGELFTFSTSSKGGRSAVGELCNAWVKHRRMVPDELPVVELGCRSYKHRDRTLGIIDVPVFKVIAWENQSLFEIKPNKPAEKKLIESKPKSGMRTKPMPARKPARIS